MPGIITWATPTELGVFIVAVTGKIITAGASNSVTTNFVLGVYSCLTSTDTIVITPSVKT